MKPLPPHDTQVGDLIRVCYNKGLFTQYGFMDRAQLGPVVVVSHVDANGEASIEADMFLGVIHVREIVRSWVWVRP